MNGLEAVRKYFPEAAEEEADYILWNHTGFPAFLDRGIGSLMKQIKRFKVLRSWKVPQCDFCGNATRESVCCFCREVLDSGRCEEN